MSRYRPYPAYKDSGVEWLGEVPDGWELHRLRWIFRRKKETGRPDAELLSVYRDHGVIPKSSRDDNFNKPSEDLSTYQFVQRGDLVLNKMKTWQGSIAISDYEGIVSPAYYVAKPTRNMHLRFIHYLLRSPVYIGQYNQLSAGIRPNQWDLDFDDFRDLPALLPPGDDQSAISNFLDRETAKLDALIAKQERLVALLQEKRQALISQAVTKGLNPNMPMKDSGVEWLGQVPAHWEVTRLKFVAQVQSGVAKGRDLAGIETLRVPYLRVANVQDGYLDLDDIAEIEIARHELPRYSLQPGDVLMNEGGDFDKLGRGHVWRGEISLCIHQNHVFAVRPGRIEPEWLSLLTSAEYGRFYFMSRSKQSTNLASISATNIGEFPVVVPQDAERRQILEWVGKESAKIDALIDRSRRSIDLLREHRTALISAAVTGKIDVRDAA